MSLLTIIQEFCERTGLPSPTTVIGTSDGQIKQVRRLLEEEGKDLSKRTAWESLTFEETHTTLAQESQGTMASIATTGTFGYILNDTIWDRTNQWYVPGPISPAEWQAQKAWVITGPRNSWRIRGGSLLVYPSPSAGWTWAFEYVTKDWLTDSAGTTYQSSFTADTDVALLSEDLMMMGLRWRWKKEKGLNYAEDFRTYEAQVKDAISRSGGKPRIRMDQDVSHTRRPGIIVPQGSWAGL